MPTTLQEQLQHSSLSLSDKYETYRNDVLWENHRGRSGVKGKKSTPTSSKAVVTRQPFKEVLPLQAQLLQAMASPTTEVSASMFKERNFDANHNQTESQRQVFSPPLVEFDETEKEKFDLMNIKIVVYGLNGLMCEKKVMKKKFFGRKSTGMSVNVSGKGSMVMGFSGSSISSGDMFSTNEADCLEQHTVPTTAVVSCQKNAISSQTSLETFLPSMPIQRPIATFVNKVRYAASWPSEKYALTKDDGARERSSFQIIRCMQQVMYVPGLGVGSNHIPETVELRVNLSRGTELIRLGTASFVINGDEEGETTMNIPAKSEIVDSKKMKKKSKRNKYSYFSDDPSRRYFLDDNATLKIGIQVIPEDAVRFAQEKEKVKREQELKQILDQGDLKELLRQMGNDNLDRTQRIEMKSLTADMFTANKGERHFSEHDRDQLHKHNHDENDDGNRKTSFSDMFCGAMTMPTIPASFCVTSPFTRPQEEATVPMEIHTDRDIDKFAIASIISSVSESTDGSFVDLDED